MKHDAFIIIGLCTFLNTVWQVQTRLKVCFCLHRKIFAPQSSGISQEKLDSQSGCQLLGIGMVCAMHLSVQIQIYTFCLKMDYLNLSVQDSSTFVVITCTHISEEHLLFGRTSTVGPWHHFLSPIQYQKCVPKLHLENWLWRLLIGHCQPAQTIQQIRQESRQWIASFCTHPFWHSRQKPHTSLVWPISHTYLLLRSGI